MVKIVYELKPNLTYQSHAIINKTSSSYDPRRTYITHISIVDTIVIKLILYNLWLKPAQWLVLNHNLRLLLVFCPLHNPASTRVHDTKMICVYCHKNCTKETRQEKVKKNIVRNILYISICTVKVRLILQQCVQRGPVFILSVLVLCVFGYMS